MVYPRRPACPFPVSYRLFGYARGDEEESIKAFCVQNGLALERIAIDGGQDRERPEYRGLKRTLKPNDKLVIADLAHLGFSQDGILYELEYFRDNKIYLIPIQFGVSPLLPINLTDIMASTLGLSIKDSDNSRQPEHNPGRKRIVSKETFAKYYKLAEAGEVTEQEVREKLGLSYRTFWDYRKAYLSSGSSPCGHEKISGNARTELLIQEKLYELDRREALLNDQEALLKVREDMINNCGARLNEREDGLSEIAALLGKREASLDERERQLDKRERQLVERERQLEPHNAEAQPIKETSVEKNPKEQLLGAIAKIQKYLEGEPNVYELSSYWANVTYHTYYYNLVTPVYLNRMKKIETDMNNLTEMSKTAQEASFNLTAGELTELLESLRGYLSNKNIAPFF